MFLSGRNWFQRQSLTFRLGVSISICVLLGVIWLCYYVAEHSRPIIKAHIEGLARRPLQDVVSDITSTGWEVESAAFTIKNTLKELPSTDVDMMKHLLHSAMQTLIHDESDAAHSWVYVFEDEDVTVGTMYSAVMDDGKFQFDTKHITNFYELYPWFKAVPKEESVFWSEPYIAERFSEKSPVVTCLIPFKFVGSTKFDGLVAVSVDLDLLKKYINKVEENSIGKFWVISRQGRFIIHPSKDLQGETTIQEVAQDKDLPQLIQAYENIQNGKSGTFEIPVSTVYDSAVMVLYAPVKDLKWGVGFVCSKKEFVEPLRELQVTTVSFILLWLACLLFLINFICHRSTKPLLDLSQIAAQYGDGNFEAKLPKIVSKDEIGLMTDAFYKMRENLLKHIELVSNAASEKQRTQSELEIAQQIQLSALPDKFPTHRAFEICAMMTAAKKVGGDFYDFFFIDETHFAMVIADVSGKGIPASLYMMNAKALIRSVAKTGVELSKVFFRVNNELCRGNTSMFVTAFLAVLDLETGVLKYVNAGHNQPFYRNTDGYKMIEIKRNMILGGMENMRFEEESLQMQSGDRLFLYTDGVNEAQNDKSEFYGNERLTKVLNQDIQSPFDALNQIKNDVAEFTHGAEQSDDLTMLELLYCKVPETTFTVEAHVKNIEKVLGYVETDMQKKKIAKDKQSRLMIITEEVFSNIAQYAYRKTGMVRIYTRLEDGMYRLCFIDNGPEYNPQDRETPDLTLSAEDRDIGGLGIFLVKKMADSVDYQRSNGQNIFVIGVRV